MVAPTCTPQQLAQCAHPAACRAPRLAALRRRTWLRPNPQAAPSAARPASPRFNSRRLVMAVAQAEPASIRRDPSPHVLDILRDADAVCFDVDSTLCEDESIDEIAAFLGVGEQVAALTAKAMGGSVPFQEALAERLGVMQVSRQKMEEYIASHPPLLSKGIPELVRRLQQRGQAVFLVSGGFHQVIDPIADLLDIPRSHVFANTILYNADGSYAGFDANEFTSRSGGKAEAVRHIKAAYGLRRVVAVGDGATDLEARQPGGAEIFIGYGGAVYRPNIAEKADWYVMDIQDILAALPAP